MENPENTGNEFSNQNTQQPVINNAVDLSPSAPEPSIEIITPIEQLDTPVVAPVITPVTAVSEVPDFNTVTDVPVVEAQPVVVAAAKPKRFTKKVLLITIAVLIVLLVGGSVSAYKFIYSNPRKVVGDALFGLITADNVKLSGVTNFETGSKSSPSSNVKLKVTIDSIITNKPSQSVDLSVEMTFSGVTMNLKANGMYTDNGDLYFRLGDNLDSYINLYFKQYAGSDLPLKTQQQIKALTNKWVKYSIDDMKKTSSESATAYQCFLDTFKKVNTNKGLQKTFADQYVKNQFILIDENNIKTQDDNLGYKISIDPKLFVAYLKSFKDLTVFNDFKTCAKAQDSLNAVDENINESAAEKSITDMNGQLSTTLWVNQWSHKLVKADLAYENNQSSYSTISLTTSVNTVVDGGFTVSAPANPTSFDEFQNQINAIMQNLFAD